MDMDYQLNRERTCKKFCLAMREDDTEKKNILDEIRRWRWTQMDTSGIALDHAVSAAAFLLIATGSCVRCPTSARFPRIFRKVGNLY